MKDPTPAITATTAKNAETKPPKNANLPTANSNVRPQKNKAPIIAAIAEALPILQYLISSSFMAIKNTHNPHFLHTVIVE